MALPNGDCSTPGDACCRSYFDIADRLLAQGMDALRECQTCDCDGLTAYVTIGSGDDAIVDALTVALDGVALAPSVRSGGAQVTRVSFVVRLRETGWPVAVSDGERIIPPDPNAQHAAALHLYAHCEALWRRLTHLQASRALLPDGVRGQCSVAPMAMLNPTAGVVGCAITVTADIA